MMFLSVAVIGGLEIVAAHATCATDAFVLSLAHFELVPAIVILPFSLLFQYYFLVNVNENTALMESDVKSRSMPNHFVERTSSARNDVDDGDSTIFFVFVIESALIKL